MPWIQPASRTLHTVAFRWATFVLVLVAVLTCAAIWATGGDPALASRLALIGLAAAAVAVPAAMLLARRTAGPVQALIQRTQALQQGDFDSPFPRGGPLEVERLSQSFEQMSATLSEQRSRMRALLDNALDAVVGMDAEGTTIDWSDRATQLFGYGREEAIGQPMHQLIIPARYQQAHLHGLRRFLATGEAVVLNRRVEIEAVHRDGHELPVELTVTPLDLGGKHVFYAFLRDLTEVRRRQRLDHFMANASTLLAGSLDFRATIQQVAKLAVEALCDACAVVVRAEDGSTEQVACVTAPGTFRAGEPEWIDRFRGDLGQVLDDGQPLLGTSSAVAPGGYIVVPMHARQRNAGAIVLVSEGRNARWYDTGDLAIAEELARRCATALDNAQLYEEARNAISVRDEFLSIASHELRTPLSPLLLQLQVIERRAAELTAGAEQRTWLQQRLSAAQAQGRRITRLVDELLDVVRIRRGELRIEPEPVDLVETVQESIGALAGDGVIDPALVTLATDRPDIVGQWDRLRVQQIVVNLLANAGRHAAGSAVHVRLAVRDGAAAAGSQVAVLSVRDEGPGIAVADQQRIFEPLERASSSRNFGGLGLGLYITGQAVHAMGGRIDLASSPGHGACFTVELPLVAVPFPAHGEARA